MEENEANGKDSGILPEDGERVAKIATEIIEPALQDALGQARELAPPQEILSALANCYSGLLIDLLGKKAAASFMEGHAKHIALLEEIQVTSGKD